MSHNPRNAKAFIAMMAAAGLGSVSYSLSQAHTWHPYQALALFAIATATSRMKIQLPRMTGNMSVNLPFLLLAVASLNLVEALAVACASAVMQSFSKEWLVPNLEQMLFNLSTMLFATALAWGAFHQAFVANPPFSSGLAVSLAAATFFLGQTMPVSTIIALSGNQPFRKVWTNMAQLTFPYFVLSAGVASISLSAGNHVGWQLPVFTLPVMFGVFRSYQVYFQSEAAAEKPLAMAATAGN